MAFWAKALNGVVDFINSQMNTKAAQIRDELKEECPRSVEGHNGQHVADSFKVLKTTRDAAISGTFLTKSVTIGSAELGAYYANYGNGGPGRVIRSTRKEDCRGKKPAKLKLKDGTYRTEVHGYIGDHYLERVAARHR